MLKVIVKLLKGERARLVRVDDNRWIAVIGTGLDHVILWTVEPV